MNNPDHSPSLLGCRHPVFNIATVIRASQSPTIIPDPSRQPVSPSSPFVADHWFDHCLCHRSEIYVLSAKYA
ncbi:hypothetical protein ASPBRDRAFT_41668 [Aspergillus brasiliensis CBS 101740]|uniref:Uncharacterized protein n=1 Tax=Aspergillus brasiliensis (strain CBS 101740 / IMI 381727 / IBT 21946) TaxID=767769 RepID=A0A1L9UQ79_ASPBC|nr:hypothetical protein ASPBRDRAFT_41668 [Aspergillus brasiliensis CBS 101740]